MAAPKKLPEDKKEEPTFNITLKAGSSSTAPWYVPNNTLEGFYRDFYGEEPPEDMSRPALHAAVMQRTIQMGLWFREAWIEAGGESAPKTDKVGKPTIADKAPSGEVQECKHGKMKYISGMGDDKKPYGFFACSLDRDDPDKCRTKQPKA